MKQVSNIKAEYKWFNQESFKNDINIEDFTSFNYPMDRIIVARYQNTAGDYLLSYLPIGTIYDNNEYLLEGCKTITYDTMGTKPYYYKGEYQLYKNNMTAPESGISFSLIFPSEMGTLTIEKPKLINKKIKPYNIYTDGLTHFSIQAKEIATDTVLLEFPIVIIQNDYTAFIKKEDEIIKIANDDMDQVLLGYTSTDKNGLVIGKIKPKNPDPGKSVIGLYNYIEGKRFFTLDEKNGFIINGPEDGSLVNLYNGNLNNFALNNCIGNVTSSYKLINEENNSGLSVGSIETPVYFLNGVPTVCTTVPTNNQFQELLSQINTMKSQILQLQQQIQALS